MALTILPEDGELLEFHKFRQINFGSTKKKDLNLCGPSSYTYNVKDNKMPDLTKSKVNFILE